MGGEASETKHSWLSPFPYVCVTAERGAVWVQANWSTDFIELVEVNEGEGPRGRYSSNGRLRSQI